MIRYFKWDIRKALHTLVPATVLYGVLIAVLLLLPESLRTTDSRGVLLFFHVSNVLLAGGCIVLALYPFLRIVQSMREPGYLLEKETGIPFYIQLPARIPAGILSFLLAAFIALAGSPAINRFAAHGIRYFHLNADLPWWYLLLLFECLLPGFCICLYLLIARLIRQGRGIATFIALLILFSFLEDIASLPLRLGVEAGLLGILIVAAKRAALLYEPEG